MSVVVADTPPSSTAYRRHRTVTHRRRTASVDSPPVAGDDSRPRADISLNSPSAAETTRTVSKIGDVEREKEIERRLAELGLTEYKKQHERRVAEALDARIAAMDGLSAVLRRCKRRHRDQAALTTGDDTTSSATSRPIDEIKNLVQQKVIRDKWGCKIAYEIRIFMGRFTRDVAYQALGHVVSICGATASDDGNDDGVKLSKDVTVELPRSADPTRVTVSYIGGVVTIHAAVDDRRLWSPLGVCSGPGRTVGEERESGRAQEFLSVSPIYSLQKRFQTASPNSVRSSLSDSGSVESA